MKAFTPPAGLGRARPRDVRLTVGGKILAVVAFLLFAGAPIAGSLMYLEAVSQRENRRLLVESSSVTNGTVLRLWREKGEKKPAYVAYSFDARGGRFEGRSKIPLARWQSLQVGGILPVRFVDADPLRNVPDGVSRGSMPLVLPFFAAGVLAGLGFLCNLVIRGQRRLLRDGRVTPARVTQHHKHKSQHGTHRSISYEFRLMNGTLAKGKSSTSSKPPAIGSEVHVLYDSEKPKRNATYPFSLVRLADPSEG